MSDRPLPATPHSQEQAVVDELRIFMKDLFDYAGYTFNERGARVATATAKRIVSLLQSETPAIAELRRLREIEHLAWHLCESSEEDVSAKTITVDSADFKALSKALPMEHPSHDGLPKGAKSHG